MYKEVDDIIGFKYNNEVYYYIKNGQNDIIGILDNNYNKIVEYIYDSWGNILEIKDNSNNNIGLINPFRYRSYYYDNETKLYYLNSRYYNPLWGRFINCDGIIGANEDILSYNLYAYCSNNPINYIDSKGNWIKWIKSIAKGFSNTFNKLITIVNGVKSVSKNAIKKVNNIKIKINSVFEVGSGVGNALEGEIFGVGVGVNDYNDDIVSINNNTSVCSNIDIKGLEIVGFGYEEKIEHFYDCKTKKAIEDPIKTKTFSIPFLDYSNGKFSTFLGFEFNFHFKAGGHIKVGVEIHWN